MKLPLWSKQHKQRPPAPPTHPLTRRQEGEAWPPVMLFQAGAGGGKTEAMAEWARQAEGGVVWYQLDAGDRQAEAFWQGWGQALRAAAADFPEAILDQPLEEGFGQALSWLVEGQRPWLVVWDGLHHAPEALWAILPELLEGLPPQLRFLLASRTRFPAAWSRWVAGGQVGLWDEDRLRFSSWEVDQWLRARTPELAEDPAFRARVAELEGWPLGVALLAEAPGRGLEDLVGGALASEWQASLLAGQEPEVQEFMLQASIFEEFTTEACREVLQADDAAQLLDRLWAQHAVRRQGEVHRFSPQVRAFLHQEAARRHPVEERRAWHRWAAEHHRRAGRPDRSIPHLVACGDWRSAAQEAVQAFPRMRHDGRQDQLARWLKAFPEEAFARDPRLLVWKATFMARAGQLVEALATYDRAHAAFAAASDGAGMFKVKVCQANIALAREESQAFGEYLLAAQVLVAQAHPDDLADLALIRGHAAEQKGDMEAFRSFNEQVLRVGGTQGPEGHASRFIAHLNLHTYHLHRGAYKEALAQVQRAVATAEAHGFAPYAMAAKVQQAHLLCVQGKLAQAEALLKALPPGWREQLDWHDLACTQVIWGHLALAQGDAVVAESRFRSAWEGFERVGLGDGQKLALDGLMWLAIRQQRPQQVAQLQAELGGGPARNLYDWMLYLPRARAALALRDDQVAAALAKEASLAFDALHAARHACHARAIEGVARLRLGERTEARQLAQTVEDQLVAGGYGFLRSWDPELMAELSTLGVAGASSSGPAVLPRSTGELAPEQAPSPQAKGKGLVLRLLGGFEAWVDGRQVEDWGRQSAKQALVALALYPRGLSLGELAEHVAGVEAQNLTRFKVAISALRRALEPEVSSGRASRFVHNASERYFLNMDEVLQVDLRSLENGLGAAERLWGEDAKLAALRTQEALAWYRGQLLDEAPFLDRFEAERESVRLRVQRASLRLAAHLQQDGQAALQVLERAFGWMPWEEEVALALMRHHARSDRRDRIRQVYWDCRKARKSCIGVGVSEGLDEAYQRLMRGEGAGA